MQSLWNGHMTTRRQQADGHWIAECSCGWVSEPAGHRDELGWVCPVEREVKAVNEAAWQIVQAIVRRPR